MITECACVVDKRVVWYFTYEYNSLNWFDLDNKEGGTVGCVPWENKSGKRLYGEVFQYKNKLVLIPYLSHNIVLYDIERGMFERNNVYISASCACIDEDNIYILGVDENNDEKLLKYSIELNEMIVLFDFSQTKKIYSLDKVWSSRMEIFNGCLVFCCGFTDLYVKFFLDTGEIVLDRLPGNISRSYGMCFFEDGLFALDFDTSKAVLFSMDGLVLEEKDLGIAFSHEPDKYYYMIKCDNRIIIDFHMISLVFEIYYDRSMIIKKTNVDPIKGRCGRVVPFDEKNFIFLPTTNRTSFMINRFKANLKNIPIPQNVVLPFLLSEQCYLESDSISLEDYLECLI